MLFFLSFFCSCSKAKLLSKCLSARGFIYNLKKFRFLQEDCDLALTQPAQCRNSHMQWKKQNKNRRSILQHKCGALHALHLLFIIKAFRIFHRGLRLNHVEEWELNSHSLQHEFLIISTSLTPVLLILDASRCCKSDSWRSLDPNILRLQLNKTYIYAWEPLVLKLLKPRSAWFYYRQCSGTQ